MNCGVGIFQGPSGAAGSAGCKGQTVRLLAARRPSRSCHDLIIPAWLFATSCRVFPDKDTLLEFYKATQDEIMKVL